MRDDNKNRGRVTRRSGTKLAGTHAQKERERASFYDDTNDIRDTRYNRNGRDDYSFFDRSRARDERSRDDRYDDRRREDRYDDHRREDRYDDRRREDRYDDRRRDDCYYDRRRDDRYDDRRREERREERHEERRQSNRKPERAPAPKQESGASETDRTVHQLLPYALLCLAPFAAISFVLRDIYGLDGSTGAFGNFLADFLCGLFGVVAYAVPLFMLVLALRWRKLLTTGKLGKKLLLSCSSLLLLAGIIHVFQESRETRSVLDTAAGALYAGGVNRAGGGFFGGFVGEWMGYILRLPGTIILGIPLFVIVVIYMVGLTPGGVWDQITKRIKLIRAKREERRREAFDGEEEPRKRIKELAPAQKSNLPQVPYAEWKQPRPIEPIRMDGKEHFVFSDEEDEYIAPARPGAQAKKEQTIAPMSSFDVLDDISDIPDVPDLGQNEIVVESAPDPQTVLREVQKAAPERVTSVPPVEEKKAEPEYYAPFALPVRPFPKREEKKGASVQTSATTKNERQVTVEQPAPTLSFVKDVVEEETLGTLARRPMTPEAAPSMVQEDWPPIKTFDVPTHKKESVVDETPAQSAYIAPFGAELFDHNEPDKKAVPVADPSKPVFFADMLEDEPEGEEDDLLPITQISASKHSDSPVEPLFGTFAKQEAGADEEDDEDTFASFDDWSDQDDAVDEQAQEAQDDAAPLFAFAREKDEFVTRERIVDQAPAPVASPIARPTPPTPAPKVRTERIVPDKTPEPEPIVREYVHPGVELLNEDTNRKGTDHSEETEEKIAVLRQTLADFNIRVKEQVDCSRGPTITRYELRPEAGVSVRSVINRIDDISLNMAAPVRIEAPIPGKPAIGIEVPNATRETVFMRTMLESEAFRSSQKPLDIPLGLGIGGDVQMCNLAAMPHLLVAGTTGSGKSVCINTILIGLMYKTSPRDLRLILIDPKQIEFAPYEHVPHLYMPIVTDMQRAAGALACAVQEMERRYSLIRDVGVRDIDSYNEAVKNDPEREHLPRIVIVIDEFADLKMSCANNDPETFTCRLAQKARAAGIHLIIGTQRPSVDVITGKLKNNIPSRIAFTVMQQVDSRTILDINGAETLTGKGDMLYMPIGAPKPARVQGAYVSDGELERVVSFIRRNNDPVQYNKAFMEQIEVEMAKAAGPSKKDDYDDLGEDEGGEDPKFVEAVELAISTQKVATSLLQRRLGVGYGRAAKIIDRMEELGLVSPAEGNKPRKLLPAAQGYLDHIRGDEGEDEEDFDEFN